MHKNNIDELDEEKIKSILGSAKIDVEFVEDSQIVYVNGENTLPYVALPVISSKASLFSQLACVREVVKSIQHQFADRYDLVVEGRDIGTEIFPNAKYKFFIIASIESRAQRRYETLKEKGEEITLDEVKESLLARDYNDSHRAISPLRKADDAIEIDTSNDTIDESLQKILSYIKG